MKRFILFLLNFIFFLSSCSRDPSALTVSGTSNPQIILNGNWEICLEPPDKFWENDDKDTRWEKIQVPGECMMQGFPVRHDKPFVYRKQVDIPSDFKRKTIKIRFEGVYSYARVWLDGQYVGDHSGGFTAWEYDITQMVEPGTKSMLLVEVTDRSDEISYASGYAKHQIGGILRDVRLLALPANYPENISIITDLDESYRDAMLVVSGNVAAHEKNHSLSLELIDTDNRRVELENPSLQISDTVFEIRNLISNPLKWDAEHPNLYTLNITWLENGKVASIESFRVGFREIRITGNRFLVNGTPVKLRGACRHDIHPLLGRVSTPEYERLDVMLAKEANINFIRTSHYPPTDHFLSLCDEYGIYVEDETAVCFVGSHRTSDYQPGSSENDPEFTGRYLSQLREMVLEHRNHPSVIIWSIGNENVFGDNFRKSYEWVKNTDKSRPVIFSYPGNVPDSIRSYDIISMHYPGTDGNMEQYGINVSSFGHAEIPVIFDEWAHVPCYNNFTIKEDPNIRNFWGMSLDSMWQKTYDAGGGLGGAIWGMIDETFMLPNDLPGYNEWWGKLDRKVIPGEYTGHTIGYGEWGIVDTWRRKKPEFYNVKKAYSPIRILRTDFTGPLQEDTLEVPVYNRFDFTNLKELTVNVSADGEVQSMIPSDIPAHSRGIIRIPKSIIPANEPLYIEFTDNHGRLIDRYRINICVRQRAKTAFISGKSIKLEEEKNAYSVICENGPSFRIDKKEGLFCSFSVAGNRVAFSGPYLNLRTKGKEIIHSSHLINDYGPGWQLKDLKVTKEEDYVSVDVKGDCSRLKNIAFHIQIFADGSFLINYEFKNPPPEILREAGLAFIMESVIDSISWDRETYWNVYPQDHLSASGGKVGLYPSQMNRYREKPDKNWIEDTKSFYYNGTGPEQKDWLTHVASATKENIWRYDLEINEIATLGVIGTGREGCRIEKEKDMIRLLVNNELDYPDLNWGNFQKNIVLKKNYTNRVNMFISAPGKIR